MRRSLLLALTCLTLAAPLRAHAGVCVEIDAARDALGEQERHGAVVLVSSLLEGKGMTVSTGGCDAIYRIYHVVFGESVTVMLSGPNGSRQTTVKGLEDLPAVYSQLVNALVDDVPLSNSNSTVNRLNVTRSLEERRKVDAEKVFFARLGAGAAANSGSDIAQALGFGIRYELDNKGVELSFANIAGLTGDVDGHVGSIFKLLGHYYFDPVSSSTPYLGAGCSWGRASVVKDGHTYEGSGLQLELVAGQEMLRASTIRLFFETAISFPLYRVEGYGSHYDYDTQSYESGDDDLYLPQFTVLMGVGFGGGSGPDHHPRGPRRIR